MLDSLLGHANCGCQFHKGSQFFIRAHNEATTVVAIRISNEDCSPVGIHG